MDIMTSYADLVFEAGNYFAYCAADELIYYVDAELDTEQGRLALLHEVSHALLGHFNYGSDFELLVMEAQAWHKTKQLAPRFELDIQDDYIGYCIDTYDQWLTRRATCPKCANFCLQRAENSFSCFMCGCRWEVGQERSQKVVISIIENAT